MFLLILAFSLQIPVDAVVDRVDLIELNHYYDPDTHKHKYDQVIFWDYHSDYQRFHVVAWVLLEAGQPPSRHPHGGYFHRWRDGEDKLNRLVRASLFRETWTTVDPERDNKSLMDEKYRRGLSKGK